MGNDQVLRQVISEAGYDAQDVFSRANNAKTKADLRARTQEAKDAGICGVPSYRVFRRRTQEQKWEQTGDIVWGQDEINVVEDIIAGWDPEGSNAFAEVRKGGSSRL